MPLLVLLLGYVTMYECVLSATQSLEFMYMDETTNCMMCRPQKIWHIHEEDRAFLESSKCTKSKKMKMNNCVQMLKKVVVAM